ncbi:class I SAM-dependent methyltransferase [Candidatus Woesearchaeota archaeon]|nr:class I SAM-dependent methyltransferase [Candidatus Woesearchaeota archaeon]
MTPHYFSQHQTSSYREQEFSAVLHGNTLTFLTASGVFSLKKIDKGSALLIEYSQIPEQAKTILDLGCGYGAVGIALAKAFPEKEVLMNDVNERAVFLCQKNIKKNNLENAKVVISDGFEKINKNFDVILLNPPQTAGKKVCEKLMEESFHHLNEKGTLQIVARHQKGGKSLSEHMKNVFGNLDILAKGGGYRVYISKKE